MGNFYEIIQTMENGDIIDTDKVLSIQKIGGKLLLINDVGLVSMKHGENGHVVELDKYNRHVWKKRENYKRISALEALKILADVDGTVYVGAEKLEFNPFTYFHTMDMTDVYDLINSNYYVRY